MWITLWFGSAPVLLMHHQHVINCIHLQERDENSNNSYSQWQYQSQADCWFGLGTRSCALRMAVGHRVSVDRDRFWTWHLGKLDHLTTGERMKHHEGAMLSKNCLVQPRKTPTQKETEAQSQVPPHWLGGLQMSPPRLWPAHQKAHIFNTSHAN